MIVLAKRHIPQFSKSWYIIKKIEFKLKVFLKKTPLVYTGIWGIVELWKVSLQVTYFV